MSLTAPERETVINFSDEDDTATIHTHQRRIITKLKNNPAAELIEDISFDGTAGAVFEVPVWAISFLSKKRKGGPGNTETLRRARKARELAVVSPPNQAVELEHQKRQLQDTTAVLEERIQEVECQSELLRSSEGRYEALVNGVSDGVILQDNTGAIVACNYTAERILGLTLTELTRPPAYRRWRVMREDGSSFPGDEFPGKLTLKSGEPQDHVVVRVERPGDTELWLLVSSRPILLGSDHERAAVTTFTDITARRQAEALLHTEREMLSRILDAATEAVVACDSNGVLTYFNPAARDLSLVPPMASRP